MQEINGETPLDEQEFIRANREAFTPWNQPVLITLPHLHPHALTISDVVDLIGADFERVNKTNVVLRECCRKLYAEFPKPITSIYRDLSVIVVQDESPRNIRARVRSIIDTDFINFPLHFFRVGPFATVEYSSEKHQRGALLIFAILLFDDRTIHLPIVAKCTGLTIGAANELKIDPRFRDQSVHICGPGIRQVDYNLFSLASAFLIDAARSSSPVSALAN